MTPYQQVRADYDRDTLVVYQAYRPEIGHAALAAGRFVPPWSTERMTWIKPSFLWMMERCGWGRKPGQEVVLGVRITRSGWERALSLAVLTHATGDAESWREELQAAPVRVQWDPERSLRGEKLSWRSIQVGLSRHISSEFNEEWIRELRDMTPLVHRIQKHREAGHWDRAAALLPRERPYPLPDEIARRLIRA